MQSITDVVKWLIPKTIKPFRNFLPRVSAELLKDQGRSVFWQDLERSLEAAGIGVFDINFGQLKMPGFAACRLKKLLSKETLIRNKDAR